MRLSSDRISRQEEVSDLFEQLGKRLSRAISLQAIDGAAMMEYRLKDATNEIDIVCMFDSHDK